MRAKIGQHAEARADKGGRRQSEREIHANQRPDHMRHDEADETDRAADRHGRTRGQHGGKKRDPGNARDIHTGGSGLFRAQQNKRQRPGDRPQYHQRNGADPPEIEQALGIDVVDIAAHPAQEFGAACGVGKHERIGHADQQHRNQRAGKDERQAARIV